MSDIGSGDEGSISQSKSSSKHQPPRPQRTLVTRQLAGQWHCRLTAANPLTLHDTEPKWRRPKWAFDFRDRSRRPTALHPANNRPPGPDTPGAEHPGPTHPPATRRGPKRRVYYGRHMWPWVTWIRLSFRFELRDRWGQTEPCHGHGAASPAVSTAPDHDQTPLPPRWQVCPCLSQSSAGFCPKKNHPSMRYWFFTIIIMMIVAVIAAVWCCLLSLF